MITHFARAIKISPVSMFCKTAPAALPSVSLMISIADVKSYQDSLVDLYKNAMSTEVDYLDKIKAQQRNWIGRSEGAEVEFKISGTDKTLTVYTTRPDTLFGATYMVVAPEHHIIEELKDYNVVDEKRINLILLKIIGGCINNSYRLNEYKKFIKDLKPLINNEQIRNVSFKSTFFELSVSERVYCLCYKFKTLYFAYLFKKIIESFRMYG